MTIVNLTNKRKPVTYTVTITHYWDDALEFHVDGVADDARSRHSVSDAMSRYGGFQQRADALHKLALKRIDALMGGAAGSAEADELAALADAVERYESGRFWVA